MKRFKRMNLILLVICLLTLAACGRKQTLPAQEDAGAVETEEVPEEVQPIEIEVPDSGTLVNKALNVKEGKGAVSLDITLVRADTQVRAWMEDAPLTKSQTVSFLDGTLHVTYGGLEETLDKDDAAESYEMPAYLVRVKAAEETDDEEESKSRYELYVFDETDDTWEKETFAPAIVTSARMMAKRMVAEPTIYYRAPDGTEQMPEEETVLSVLSDDPGEFVLQGSLDHTQLTELFENFSLSDALPEVRSVIGNSAEVEDNVQNVLEGIDLDALKQFAEENKDAVKQFAEEHGEEVQQFLGEQGEALQELWNEHGEEIRQFFGEQGENLQEFLEEHGDEIGQFLEENGDAVKQFASDAVTNGQQAVQGAQDFVNLKRLFSLSERPVFTAVFDAVTQELKFLTIHLENVPEEGSKLYLKEAEIVIRYDNHETQKITLPADVKETAEDKEQGMMFHRMMEEMERIGKR